MVPICTGFVNLPLIFSLLSFSTSFWTKSKVGKMHLSYIVNHFSIQEEENTYCIFFNHLSQLAQKRTLGLKWWITHKREEGPELTNQTALKGKTWQTLRVQNHVSFLSFVLGLTENWNHHFFLVVVPTILSLPSLFNPPKSWNTDLPYWVCLRSVAKVRNHLKVYAFLPELSLKNYFFECLQDISYLHYLQDV